MDRITAVEAIRKNREEGGKPPVMLAHPGSGTRFLMAELGEKAKIPRSHIAHESINPNQTDPYDLMILGKYWDMRQFPGSPIWHWVREPIRVVFSAEQIFPHPRGAKDLLNAFGFRPSKSVLHDMLWTVTELNNRAEKIASRRFRLEDQPGDADPAHTHNPKPINWDLLYKANIERTEMLREQTIRYGYSLY